MKWNGWQRLWVLVGAVYLIGLIVMAWEGMPSVARIKENWALDLVALNRALPVDCSYAVHARMSMYGGMSDDRVILSLKALYDKSDNIETTQTAERINTTYIAQLATVSNIQAKLIGKTILRWVVPMVVLYGLGAGIAWVRQGFMAR